jgi:hypothetical protein
MDARPVRLRRAYDVNGARPVSPGGTGLATEVLTADRERSADTKDQAEKLLPHPQPPVAFGFLNVKPEPCIEVTWSTTMPARYCIE